MEQTQGRRPPSVLVAVLHTGQIRWELAAWLTRIAAAEKRGKLMIQFFGEDAKSHPVNSNRNRILADTPLDADAVLMLDEDTVPHPATIEIGYMCCPEDKGGLGLDIVLAPVPIMRSDDERGPILANLVPLGEQGGNRDNETVAIGSSVIQEIKEGGTGVIAIARHVINHPDMRGAFGFEYDDDGCTIVGEDHLFCRRARAAGFKVHAALGYPMGHAKVADLKSLYEMCNPQPPRPLSLLVTGTGRCGTGYIANWLTSAGLRCGHEAIFMHRGMEAALKRASMFTQFRADASWMAAPYLGHEYLAGVPVVHAIRHPARVVASWIRKGTEEYTPRYWNYLTSHLPELNSIDRQVDQFAARYVLWTEIIQCGIDDHPAFIWRVEDGEEALLRWLADSNILDARHINRDQLFPDKSYNHKGGPGPDSVALADISEPWRERIAEIAARYGYEWQ